VTSTGSINVGTNKEIKRNLLANRREDEINEGINHNSKISNNNVNKDPESNNQCQIQNMIKKTHTLMNHIHLSI